MQDLCATILYLVGGFNTDQFNKSMIPKLLAITSAGASIKQVEHFLQIYKSEKFRMFDYGTELNNVLYRQDEPIDYPLEKLTSQVYLFYGLNDWLVSEKVKDAKNIQAQINYSN
jgi:lysosomal acid lipase/cholesteryl ester hydrolase